MKEIGVSWTTRMAAKGLKPRLIISENDGKWTVRSESAIKTVVIEFTPGVEFDETTPDGRQVRVCLLLFYISYIIFYFKSQPLTLKAITGFIHQLIKMEKNLS